MKLVGAASLRARTVVSECATPRDSAPKESKDLRPAMEVLFGGKAGERFTEMDHSVNLFGAYEDAVLGINKRLARLPCLLVTGFLGAGKSTLVGQIMRSRANLRIAVLQNELAELHVDTKLLSLTEENGAYARCMLIVVADALLHATGCAARGKLVNLAAEHGPRPSRARTASRGPRHAAAHFQSASTLLPLPSGLIDLATV